MRKSSPRKKQQSDRPASKEEDARVQKSKEKVLGATLKLLMQEGFGGVSVDAVSKLSGVAKTTIYRHWPSRSALLVDTCTQLGQQLPVPDTGTLTGDLLAIASTVAGLLQSHRIAAVLPSIIDAAEKDSEFAKIHSQLHGKRMSAFYAVIDRAQQRGDFPSGKKPSEIVAGIVGPLFYRRWLSRETLDEHFVRVIVENAIKL